ncbi:MAG: adenylate cyclase [Colwellia sp.]|jgi:CYTH domain-containing protein|nr:MAG: adenylate cyclase [Colwellia sp.]
MNTLQDSSAQKNAPQEIERKFLVAQLPNLSDAKQSTIHQGYITHSDDSVEVRLRQKESDFYLTVKQGAGLIRTEVETTIVLEQFVTLWPLTIGSRIEKIRWTGNITNNLFYELDIFSGELESLQLVEVEFSSRESAEKFIIPAWFGKEVTEDKRFKNKSLAMNKVVIHELLSEF